MKAKSKRVPVEGLDMQTLVSHYIVEIREQLARNEHIVSPEVLSGLRTFVQLVVENQANMLNATTGQSAPGC